MNAKKLEKVVKILGQDTVTNLETTSVEGLKAQIVASEQAMETVQNELEANPQYQELKESLKALCEGKKEVNKRQKAIISFCLHLLDEK